MKGRGARGCKRPADFDRYRDMNFLASGRDTLVTFRTPAA
jgi:hypothetical protein